MGKPKRAVEGIRVNLYLYPDIAAALKLACADTSFGGIRYGEQTRIVNQALRNYFEGTPACTPPKPQPESTNSAP
jgi:hypothetical protein